jgi:prepilin-type N-terminal cleavage/methylation domain-containing protein
LTPADFLRAPEAHLRALCARLGSTSPSACCAGRGPRDSDGIWAPHWYAAVWASTGFEPWRPREVRLDGEAERVAEACRSSYERLRSYRNVGGLRRLLTPLRIDLLWSNPALATPRAESTRRSTGRVFRMRKPRGFTLIELMIVVAIIAILAAIAISQYQDYVIRSEVAEGASLAGGVETSVAEFYNRLGRFPAAPCLSSNRSPRPGPTQLDHRQLRR